MRRTTQGKSAGSRALRRATESASSVLTPPAYDFTGATTEVFRKKSCPCGGGCPDCQSQSSGVAVSQPTDASEIEADQLADRVMRMPAGAAPSASRALSGKATDSGGSALDPASRSFFEPRFGMDFGHVRVHSDSVARESARSFDARAYTFRNHIVFGGGEYRPNEPSGQQLLAHELAHVALHGGSSVQARGPAIHRKGDPQSPSSLTGSPAPKESTGDASGADNTGVSGLVSAADMKARGISIGIPEGEPIVGRNYRLGILHPNEVQALNSLSDWDFTEWYVKPPGKQKFGYRSRLGQWADWTLDAPGVWAFAAEVPMPGRQVGILIHKVEVREPDVVALEKLNQVKGTSEAAFLIGLEMKNLENVNLAVREQKYSDAFISLSGSNPAVVSGEAPNLPVNVYTANAPKDGVPTSYQWAAIPSDPALLDMTDRFGQHPRTIEGRKAFDLGTGSTARWTIHWDPGFVDIYCWMRNDSNQLLGLARYRQVILTQKEAKQAERFQEYMADARLELRKLRPETAVFVPSAHLATETGQSNELSFFFGRAADTGELMLVDVTPGVPRREYRGADFDSLLKDFGSGNAYPVGQVVLRVPQNTFGIKQQDWRIRTEGASVARRLSTGWGWASLGLAGLGVLAAIVPGGQPLAPAFFMAAATVGAASAAASLYDRAHEAHPSNASVAIDIAQLAGSLFGMAGAANVLRHGARIAAATRTGQFVLYAGFATDAVGGVFLAAEGAAHIADILDSKMSTDEKVSAVVRILSGMLVTGTLLAWSAGNLSATTKGVTKVLGEEVAAGLSKSDLTALSILDERALKGVAGASQEEVKRIAAVIREDPVRAARLAQVHGGGNFLESARARQGSLDDLARDLDLQRRAALIGFAATQLDTVITDAAAKRLSKQLGVTVRVDPDIAPGRIEIDYTLGSWLKGTDITIKAGTAASVGDVLVHGLAMESVQNYRLISGSFRETYTRARAWLKARKMSGSAELLVELEKHAMHHEARLQALKGLELSPELERRLTREITELEGWMASFRSALVAEGAPLGVIAVDLSQFKEYVSQGDIQRLLDAPGSNFARLRHSTSGNLIREPGFRDGQSIDMGRSQAKFAGGDVTYPDIFGRDLLRGVDVAMEIKSPRAGESVASHFQKWEVASWILEQHGGRVSHLPATAEYYLVVDLRACGQTAAEALADLSRVLRNYAGRGDVRNFWDGVRFLEGSWRAPTLSAPVVIP